VTAQRALPSAFAGCREKLASVEAGTYLNHLKAEGDRLAVAAREAGLDAPVPTCADWDVSALVAHVAAVYDHKLACMRLQRRPEESEWAHEPPSGRHVVDWLTDTLADLVAELRSRGPEAASYTWYPTDQTVGFWYRRMANETAVHRIDAELAAGHSTPVDDELALDGIDEMLVAFLAGPWWETDPVPDASGRTVAVRAGGELWRATLEPGAVGVSRSEGRADATVEGEPSDVLMWLWRREPARVSVDGDAVEELQERLAYFT